MAYALKVGDGWQEIVRPFITGDGDAAIQRPANWPDLQTEQDREEQGVFELPALPAQPSNVQSATLVLIDQAGRPAWSWQTEAYSLEAAKAAIWSAAQVHRDERTKAGCATASGTIQTDPDSQRIIVGAVTTAMLAKQGGQPFSINFTMADNSVVALDADGMIAVGLAVSAHIAACHDVGTSIRNTIEAATTTDAVFAIDITAGYPA